MVIDIPVIHDLALTASIGVAVLIFTNLILLPVLLSYVGVSPAAAQRSLRADSDENRGRGFNQVWVLARALHRAALGHRRDRACGRADGRRRSRSASA